jgi:hypothetical protein
MVWSIPEADATLDLAGEMGRRAISHSQLDWPPSTMVAFGLSVDQTDRPSRGNGGSLSSNVLNIESVCERQSSTLSQALDEELRRVIVGRSADLSAANKR